MKRKARAASWTLAVAWLGAAPAAMAQLEETTVGIWRVSAHSRDGAFSHCAMSTRAAHSSRLLFFYLTRNRFQVGMYDRDWNIAPGTRFLGYYRIDGGATISASATMMRGSLLNLSLRAERVVFEQFRTASTLTVGVEDSPEFGATFSLPYSAAAFDRLFACVQAGVRMAQGPKPDPSEQAGDPPERATPPQRSAAPPNRAAAPPPARTAERPASRRNAPPSKPADPTENAIGTGFYVSAAGHIVTAEHVVRGCKSLRAQSIGDVPANVVLVAQSKSDDLALLKADGKRTVVAPIRVGGVRLGEQIVLFGFPLPGALASSGNLTTGNVAALAGLRDDHRILQISAPAQPGNSGGPILDLRGRVVGVLVHSVSISGFARVTGTLPQNLNFGVKASVLSSFLEAHGVSADPAGAAADLAVADVAERARAFTVRIECLN
jgi:S1-C subfamily serine protease